jgi:NAD(P)-dependent dehydrogenase (short-subunit alcohol dehydrogenase family)
MVANLGIKRVSDLAETATAITFLASPAASYITGAVLDSNGGYTAGAGCGWERRMRG